MSEYTIKGKTTLIHFTSRGSVKVGEKYYTIEYGEDRQINADDPDVDIQKERNNLINTCNLQVDKQIEEICQTFL